MRWSLRIVLLLAVATASRAGAAVRYRFSSVAEQSYAKKSSGTVLVDGNRWRINYDRDPDKVMDVTAIIGSPDGSLIALNDENQTWFKLTSRSRLSADAMLFTYAGGSNPRVSKLKVSTEPAGDVTFSYRIDMNVGGVGLRGEVWGRIHVVPSDKNVTLPWNPLELHTGLEAVDVALSTALSRWGGRSVTECDIEVSRRLENGAVLTQKTRRTVSDFSEAAAPKNAFAVPAGYRYQEPVLGIPGGH